MNNQCRLVHFSGTVQGVGFRYTARQLARSYKITGYVKNLPDGRVEMLLEGPAEEIDAFLAAIRNRMAHYITAEEHQLRQPTEKFTSFEIRF